ncbi:hypothetical protein HPB51_016861 [Rhipicephalus microplus]|uniref:Uncharacterized protein n=1 Tax=Rhipicephalus microplus TaxID=6941 RepID=A0A9J6DIP0_RHIMP|nr:hypothetical protein HPB51_016861 [Rhipicephalus microplus]
MLCVTEERKDRGKTPTWVFSEAKPRKTSHHCTRTSQRVPVQHSAVALEPRATDHDPEGDQPPGQDPYLGLFRFASQDQGLTRDHGPPRPRRRHSRRSIVEQLKAEIAEIKGAKLVNAARPSRLNMPVENIGESPIAEVPMDTHSEVRLAKRKATTEHMRNEKLDFQVQIPDSSAEIKETLKQMTESMASLGAGTSKLEEELSKLRAKKGVKSPVKSRATSLGATYGSSQAGSADTTNDGCE